MQDKQRERAHLLRSDRHLGSTSHDRDSLLNVWPRGVTFSAGFCSFRKCASKGMPPGKPQHSSIALRRAATNGCCSSRASWWNVV
jgi:hypothetical protein